MREFLILKSNQIQIKRWAKCTPRLAVQELAVLADPEVLSVDPVRHLVDREVLHSAGIEVAEQVLSADPVVQVLPGLADQKVRESQSQNRQRLQFQITLQDQSPNLILLVEITIIITTIQAPVSSLGICGGQ